MLSVHVRPRPQDIFRNEDTPLDADKYPVQPDRLVTMRFYSNLYAKTLLQRMPSDDFVVLWDGAARQPRVVGEGVTNVSISRNRISFSLDTSVRGQAIFHYTNVSEDRHVRNIRIVPRTYESDYADWSWSDYQVGARSNPPIFFPQWLDKMRAAEGCVIRYVNSTHTNDRNVIITRRDSSKHRIKPANSVWYEGFGMGFDVEPRHGLPWEIIAEASLQTGTVPWINFRVFSYENLKNGDTLVRDVARMFHENYGGPIYLEYGNEIWNYSWPFDVASDYVRYNGPGLNDNIGENYALRSSAIYSVFSRQYKENACLVQGVLGGQARNPWHAEQRVMFSNLNFADVVSPATYVGDNLVPDNAAWDFVAQLFDDVRLGRTTQSQAFDRLRDELLTGEEGVMVKNWRNDVAPYIEQHLQLARNNQMCTAIYETGLNLRVDRTDSSDERHSSIRDFVRSYRLSPQQAEVEREVYEWLKARIKGPAIAYSSVESSGNGTFSYWDTIFDDRRNDSPRTKLISEFSDNRAELLSLIIKIERRVSRAPLSDFGARAQQGRLLNELYELAQAIFAGSRARSMPLFRKLLRRVDGCGSAADANDWIRACPRQVPVQKLLNAMRPNLTRL